MARLRGIHFGLVINDFEEDSPRRGAITIQTANLFDLVKDHPLSSGFLKYLLANRVELIKVAKDFLAQFQALHPYAAGACKHFPVVLAGISNPL